MDYVEEIFNKYYSDFKTKKYNLEEPELNNERMTLKDFRKAVKEIEAHHLRRVCE